MHKKAMKMMEKLCEKIDAIGVDNMTLEQVEEAKCWSTIANNMAQLDYNVKIIDEMEKAEYGEDYDENGPLRQFSSRMHPRSSRTGRFVDRNYTEPMHDGRMMNERMYDDGVEYPIVTYREGNRHYTDGGMNGGTRNMNYTSSEYDRRRRTYMDKKKMGENATKQMDEAMDSLKDSVMAMTKNANSDERMIARQKIMKLAESIPQ